MVQHLFVANVQFLIDQRIDLSDDRVLPAHMADGEFGERSGQDHRLIVYIGRRLAAFTEYLPCIWRTTSSLSIGDHQFLSPQCGDLLQSGQQTTVLGPRCSSPYR